MEEIKRKEVLVQSAVNDIMCTMRIECTPDNEKTPQRIAKMFVNELFSSVNDRGIEELKENMTVFDNPNKDYKAMPITLSNIKFYSMCEHHWLPFYGYATVTYVPRDKIIGLSKIPRVVEYFSKRPQVQERLARDIAKFLWKVLDPESVRVELHNVHHMCVEMRGIESEGCVTDTVFEI